MTPAFENALKARGLDTKYAKYLVAQSALESNWGKVSQANSTLEE